MLSQTLREAMMGLDRIASDGAVIRSLFMPILSPVAVKKMEEFLGSNTFAGSIFLMDKGLFPIEVLPSWSLNDDLSEYENFMAEVVASSEAISDPRSRLFIPEIMAGQAQKIIFVRPILSVSDSITQPFQVNGLLLVTIPVEKMMAELMSQEEEKPELIRLMYGDRVIYEQNNQNIFNIQHTPIIIGTDDKSMSIVLGRSEKDVLAQVLFGYRMQAVVAVLFLMLMAVVIKLLADKLAHPLQVLSQITANMSAGQFGSTPMPAVATDFIHYREFSEVFGLLKNMDSTIREQFKQLQDANTTLEDKVAERTHALEKNLHLLDQQRTSLNGLVQYSIDIQLASSLEEVGPMTLLLAKRIFGQHMGCYILRNEYFAGYRNFEGLEVECRDFLRENAANLNDYASLLRATKDEGWLQVLPIGSSTSSYQGFLITHKTERTDQAAEALMVLATMLGSAIKQYGLNSKLHHLAHIDAVTHLPNRHYFTSKFNEKLHSFTALDENSNFGVFVIDVNGLKYVNDHFGHKYGDEMLKVVAEAIKGAARANDTTARVGGDEFYIILESAKKDSCERFAERLLAVSSSLSMNIEGEVTAISFSFGFASTDVDSLKNLLPLADERMYYQKQRHYQNKNITPR
jgi:diguanylate cyclase (GGDEF)-like protein